MIRSSCVKSVVNVTWWTLLAMDEGTYLFIELLLVLVRALLALVQGGDAAAMADVVIDDPSIPDLLGSLMRVTNL